MRSSGATEDKGNGVRWGWGVAVEPGLGEGAALTIDVGVEVPSGVGDTFGAVGKGGSGWGREGQAVSNVKALKPNKRGVYLAFGDLVDLVFKFIGLVLPECFKFTVFFLLNQPFD